MQELIEQLQEKAGLTAEQAKQSIEVVKEYVKGKLPPFIAGTVDNWFAGMADKSAAKKESFAEKAGDFLDDVKDKVEDWSEEAADKAGQFAQTTKDKVSGLFNKDQAK